LRYSVAIAGTITLAIGASWLVAWFLGIAAQWSANGIITVKTNMALGQVLAGAALLLLEPASVGRRRRWVGAAAAALVILIGGLTLSEHLFHSNLGIDQLLATEASGAVATDSPNRIGLYGSVSLALLGAGLFALALRRRSITPYLGLVVCLINLLPAVGFLYGIDELYKLPHANIAWPSVVALISLGLGLVLARSDGGPAALLLHEDIGGILLRRLLPAMLLVPLVLGFLRIQGERHGLYDTATGTGMLVIAMAVLFSFFLWPTAARLSRLAAEQDAARQAVLKSKDLLNTFILEAPVSIAMFNRNMCYLQASNRWLQETGVADQDVSGKSHYEIFPNLPEQWTEMHRRGLAGESLKAEDDWTAADGQTHSIRWEIHPWGDSGTDTGGIIISFEDVTERKRTRQRIAHLASFPELNQSPIFEADWEGQITYANPAARRLFPTLEETGAKHPLLKEWSSVAGALSAGTKPVIVREVDSDGLVLLESIHSPQSGILRAYLVDITERKRAEQALRTSEERWVTTLRSIGDAVISTCAQGKIIFMNDVAQTLTGWPLPEAEGKDLSVVFNIIQENTRVKPEDPVSKVIRLGNVVGLANHTALISRDGTEIPVEDSGAPIRNREGQIEGVVLVFHDVSEQRKVEKALRDSERLATTGRLAATLAHEIHNPLEAVVNLLFLIDSGTQEKATRRFASMASQELERIAQMTQQMLTFHRESATPIAVQIKEVLGNVLALYERKIQSAAIQVETEIRFEGTILAQPGELRQVFANLVGNAIEAVASDHGKLALRAYASRDWRRGRPGLRVVVADNGRGIPAEIREKIFDPFFTTKGESGTGLGLWITAGIVNKYGGTLRLRSTTRAGRSGTCFSLFFPTDRGQE
jgi:PAS domain S-box-containing protein